jgi:hypothetical protein
MHFLTWVGFGLLGYVPNTLYKEKETSNSLITPGLPRGNTKHDVQAQNDKGKHFFCEGQVDSGRF